MISKYRILAAAAASVFVYGSTPVLAGTTIPFFDGTFTSGNAHAGADFFAGTSVNGDWYWENWSSQPSGGNPGAYLNHNGFNLNKAVVGLDAVPSGSMLHITFDLDRAGYTYEDPTLQVMGMTTGQTVGTHGDGAVEGIELLNVSLPDTNFVWTPMSYDVPVTGTFNDIAFVFTAGSDDPTGIRAVDNFSVSLLQAQWALDGGGTWNNANNWTDHTIPAGAGTAHANFLGNPVNNDAVVTLDGDRAVAGVTFDNAAHQYTIAQGSSGTLTLGDGTVTATIDVNSGTHVISAPVALASNTTITVAASSAMNLTGAVSISGGKNITKAGPGSASIGGLSGAAGNIDQSAGTLNLSVDAGTNLSANRVRLNGLSLAANASLTLNQGAGGAATASKVETLAMDPTATLNMKNNSMVINTGTLAAIRPLVVGGKIFGNANVGGAGTKATAIGYAAGNDPNIAGLNNSLAGQSFGAGSVLLKYTYVGDANLDGSVDGSDVALWAQNFSGALGLNPPNPRTWTQGDWNNDGSVDGSDVALWAQNFTGALGGGGLGDLVIDVHGAGAAVAVMQSPGVAVVPEPSTAGIIGLGALSLLTSRRRRH